MGAMQLCGLKKPLSVASLLKKGQLQSFCQRASFRGPNRGRCGGQVAVQAGADRLKFRQEQSSGVIEPYSEVRARD